MARYIDADKLQEAFKELHGGKRSLLIDTQPTADVVEVVRCKDCEHGQSYNMFGSRYCLKHNDVAVRDNDFCSYGERADA